MGRTCEPPVVIFDQTCNVPSEGHEFREQQEIVFSAARRHKIEKFASVPYNSLGSTPSLPHVPHLSDSSFV